MILLRLFCGALLLLALTAPSVRADDICLGDDEEKAAKAQVAALNKVEKTGSPAELFVAYQALASNDCIDRYDKNAQARAKANLPKLAGIWPRRPRRRGFCIPVSRCGPMGRHRPSGILKPWENMPRPTG